MRTSARSLPPITAIALLLHTSGTTGPAKVVPLRRRNLIASALAIGSHYELTPDDVSHCVMPLFHVHGLVASTLAPLLWAGRHSAAALQRKRVGPRRRPWCDMVLRCSNDPSGLARPSSWADGLRHIGSASHGHARQRYRPSVMESFERAFEIPLVEAYGMTEAAHQMAFLNVPPPGVRKPGRRRFCRRADQVVMTIGCRTDRRIGEVAVVGGRH